MIKKFINGKYGLGITFWAGFISPFGFIKLINPLLVYLFVHFFYTDEVTFTTIQTIQIIIITLSWIWVIPASIAVWNAGKLSKKVWMILSRLVVGFYWLAIMASFFDIVF